MSANPKSGNHPTRIHSLFRAMEVLELIAKEPNGLQIKEISISLQVNLSTCYHTLNTLEDSGYLVKKVDGSYVLGPKIPYLYHFFLQSIGTQKLLQDKLYDLRYRTNETAYLGAERNNRIEIQLIVQSSQPVRVHDIYVGCNDHPHARVLPKAIMAYWDEKEIDQYFEHYEFTIFNTNTPKNVEELKVQLANVRAKGYSIDDEGLYPGVSCISAPVFGAHRRPIAAFGLAVPSERFREKKAFLIEQLLLVAKEASYSFGYMEDQSVLPDGTDG